MLSVTDLINRETLPKEKDISLLLLLDFYEQYLCRNIYIFTLENEEQIKIVFKDSSEIFHLIGAKHIYGNLPMSGKRFAEEIRNGSMNFYRLKQINPKAYKDYYDRICSLACIDTVLKKSQYLWFQDGKIQNSAIAVKYLLFKNIDDKCLHLGIDKNNKGKTYFPRTLLVTDGNRKNKFINMADKRLIVKKLEIRNKRSNELVELINREKAQQIAEHQVKDTAISYLKKYTYKKKTSAYSKELILGLEKCIYANEEIIRLTVAKEDPYWTKKITAETIREYLKNDAEKDINRYINS